MKLAKPPMTTPSCAERIYRNAGNLPLLALLGTKPGCRVLDCGCGAGDNARVLKSRGWTVTGITISLPEQQTASAYCDKVFLADLDDGIPEQFGPIFDVVLLSHILEHLVHPENLLRDAKKVLSPGGSIAVALPNVLAYPNRLRLMFGNFEYTPTGVMDETHVRFFTFATGAMLLRSNGYRLVAAKADGAFPLWRLRRALPSSIVQLLNQSATKYCPGLFGFQSLYLASADA
jgi:2-polyprenyl-3-methyl-5-hydroxy-6-metoxy-1,4-benzoquinol methylase